jgi:cell wall-associated NlpC family hydrolase
MMNARRYIGIPYKEHGRDWDGCNCYGLIRLVYMTEFGIELPSLTEAYASVLERREADGLVGRGESPWAKRVEIPHSGDVIRLRRQGEPKGDGTHAGIVVDPIRETMLHIHNNTSAAIESYAGLAWRHRVDEFLKWVG